MMVKMIGRAAVLLLITGGLIIGGRLLAFAEGNQSGLESPTVDCDVPSGSYPTIQSAVDASCDVINLTADSYVENITISNQTVTILGQGAALTTIDGNATAPVFVVEEEGNLTLESVTLTNGYHASIGGGGGLKNYGIAKIIDVIVTDNHVVGGRGGGLLSYGSLTIEDSSIISNTATAAGVIHGGGLYASSGTVTVTNSIIDDNYSSSYGGGIGIDAFEPVVLNINNSVIIGNRAKGGGGISIHGEVTTNISGSIVKQNIAEASGGGISNEGNMTIIDSEISENEAVINIYNQTCGGGIYNSDWDTFPTTLIIERTLIQGNVTSQFGAGICTANASVLTVDESIFFENISYYEGGAIFASAYGETVVQNSTISNNQGGEKGGGVISYGIIDLVNVTMYGNLAFEGSNIYAYDDVQIVNSIIAGQPQVTNCTLFNNGQIISLGYNIATDDSCVLNGPGDLPDVNPLLGSLANNGGPTQTHALSEDSPAIDSANSGVCPSIDQRGVSRPQGSGCDIGAYEYTGEFKVYMAVVENG